MELQRISKRGDTYLRTLLVHGVRSIIYRVKEPGPWVTQMKQRHPLDVIIVAMATKACPNNLGNAGTSTAVPKRLRELQTRASSKGKVLLCSKGWNVKRCGGI